MKKFSKKSLLSFMTVSAIVVTMAGSYAVWDKLDDTKTVSLTLDKPVTATITAANFAASGDRVYGTARTYTSTTGFAVANVDDTTKVEAEITPVVKVGNDVVTDQFDIVVKDGADTLTPTSGIYKDTSVTASNSYTIEITPKTTASATVTDAATAGTNLSVDIKGELKNVTP